MPLYSKNKNKIEEACFTHKDMWFETFSVLLFSLNDQLRLEPEKCHSIQDTVLLGI